MVPNRRLEINEKNGVMYVVFMTPYLEYPILLRTAHVAFVGTRVNTQTAQWILRVVDWEVFFGESTL